VSASRAGLKWKLAGLCGNLARLAFLWAGGQPLRGWRDWNLTMHPGDCDLIVIECPEGDPGGTVHHLPKEAVVAAFDLWNKAAAYRKAGGAQLGPDGLPACDNPDCPDCNPPGAPKPAVKTVH